MDVSVACTNTELNILINTTATTAILPTAALSAEQLPPSYLEVLAQTQNHVGPIPSYKQGGRLRYHPYVRHVAKEVDETERLLNTIYDEELVMLNVPPPRPGAQRRVFPLVPGLPMDDETRRRLERAISFERRVHRLQPVLLEFFEGVQRAHRT
ncbi:hypothetical protein NLJ89_g10370 [Agrocybe chaxingu]|uniref:Uncharacterized protein n=1 Tax=Agrocybe chaxingu TaxID=84603 RepID=A0A9W8JP01_9AGAR|nr:hypothetical protein NLJ89_g10370 [Agrocybe chaxingu]